MLKNGIIKKIATLFAEERSIWNIGIVNKPIYEFLNRKPEVEWIDEKDKNTFLADPFGLEINGELFILAEKYDYKEKKGYICLIKDNKEQQILKTEFHMSYPFLIEENGGIYCIPETHQANELVLYLAKEFPFKWEKIKVLIKKEVVDASFIKHHGLWWMFYTLQDDPHGKLYVSYAKTITGTWEDHKGNPIKEDNSSSRSAGTLFKYKGKIFRPAQDCSRTYGGAIKINEITKLTVDEFAEKTVKTIEPYMNSIYKNGIHTISAVGNITLVDGKRYIYKLRSLKEIIRIFKEKFKQYPKQWKKTS